jgi:hypothetical protein
MRRPKHTAHTLPGRVAWAGLALGLLLLAAGCGLGGQNGEAESANPTLTALSAAVARTATAAQQEQAAEGELATAEAEATQRSESIYATQTAQVASRPDFALATATVAAPILAELPQYGLQGAPGTVGWLHDPLTLELTAFHDYTYGNDHMNVTARDFVVAADITWDTQYGGSGCGFMFRSNGNQNNLDQYVVVATRFSGGRVIFTALADGELANLHDFYPRDEDRSFDWQNGSTNRLAVVARGPQIQIYTNGVKVGALDTTQPPKLPIVPAKPLPPIDAGDQAAAKRYQDELKEYQEIVDQAQANYQAALKKYQERQAVFEDGFLAMLALSESGHTLCTFENAWLYLLE